MPQRQQFLANQLFNSSFLYTPFKMAAYSQIEKLLSRNLPIYNFLAQIARKLYSPMLHHFDHAENTYPLFYHCCKHDCCSSCLAIAVVCRVISQKRLGL
jgi:hypothetical protein